MAKQTPPPPPIIARLSNGLVGFINVLTLLISAAAIVSAIVASVRYSSTHPSSQSVCEQHVLVKPLLYVGLSLLVVSLLGLVGSCYRVRALQLIYLLLLFVLILGLVCFTAFALAVTNEGVGNKVSGMGYKEYHLGDYSRWLQRYVVNEKHWGSIQSCLVDAKVCNHLGGGGTSAVSGTANIFAKRSLTPIQSGCCKPPSYCILESKRAPFWTVRRAQPRHPADADCMKWSNNQDELCYGCNSCKAGVLAKIKKEWRLLVYINSGILVLVIVVFFMGCCALRNSKRK